MARKSWFSMSAKSDDLAEIEIFDEIDSYWGIGPKEFKAALDEAGKAKSIKLLLNSPGGSVFDGMAIYNLLAQYHDKLEIEVVGLAASIASIIAMAGKKLTIAEGAYLMIHQPWTVMAGGAEDLRKTADLLDKMEGQFIGIYSRRSGLKEDEVEAMMAAETWLTGDEAVAKGLADAVEDYGQMAALCPSLGKYNYAHIPETLAKVDNKKVNTPRELEGILRDAGFSRRDAVALVSHGWKALDQGEPVAEPRGEPESTAADDADKIKLRIRALLASSLI